MAEATILNAEVRTTIGKGIPALRRSGKIPGVVYGRNLPTTHIQLDEKQLTNTLRNISRNRLITLEFGDAMPAKMVLTREVQRNPIKRTIKHVDFYEVSMTEKITALVRVVCVGESADVKGGQGVVNQELDEIEIRCLPADLIEKIEVDVSMLGIDQAINVGDLRLPDGIEVLDDPDAEIVRIIRYQEEKAEAVVAETNEPEVIEKGKKEEEEAD